MKKPVSKSKAPRSRRTRPLGAPLPASHGKHPGGRTPKHTPELVAKLADALASGMTDQQAADLVGIHSDTLREWGKKEDEFSAALAHARAKRLYQRLCYFVSGAPGWQAVAWILERAYGRQFARPKATVKAEYDLVAGLDGAGLKEVEELLGLM